MKPDHAIGTPFRAPQQPARHGFLWVASNRYLVDVPSDSRRSCRPAVVEDASHQSLQPTCCHEHPNRNLQFSSFPARAVATAPSGPALRRARLYALLDDTVHVGAGYPRGNLRPRVAPRWVPRAPAVTMTSAAREGRLASFGDRDCNLHQVFSTRHKPRGLATDAPCRTTRLGRGIKPGLAEQHRGPFPQTMHQHRRFPSPERLPPMDPAGRRPLTRTTWRGGRHWYLGLAASTQLPTCVRAQRYAH